MLRVESDYTHVESALPAIVRTSCVGDSVLHFVEGELVTSTRGVEELETVSVERMLGGYTYFGRSFLASSTCRLLHRAKA